MKAVFLDIDGVLNSSRSVAAKIGLVCSTQSQIDAFAELTYQFGNKNGELPFPISSCIRTIDPVAVSLVNSLLTATSANLVLSSTHRTLLCGNTYNDIRFSSPEHLAALRLYLTALGIDAERLIGITPQLWKRRGEEVRDFLERSIHRIEEHVILDDGRDFFPFQPLVRVDPNIGLTLENQVQAMKHLGLDSSPILLP